MYILQYMSSEDEVENEKDERFEQLACTGGPVHLYQ